MDKIKAKLNKYKEEIDLCEEREKEARSGLTEAKGRLDVAENDKASHQRRLKLLKKDLDKTNEQVRQKQEELYALQSKTAEDEVVVKQLETQEVEGDEKLETLNDLVKRGQLQAEDHDLQCREAGRKIHVLKQEVERAENRYEVSSIKIEQAIEKLDHLGGKIKSLEEREYDQSERETENEQKVAFLQQQEKEALVRAENAERDAVRLERVVEGLLLDIHNWRNKKEDVLAEMSSVSSLADDI